MRQSYNLQKSAMAYEYSSLIESTKNWAEQAKSAGWLTADVTNALSNFDSRTPDTLFKQNGVRPLIVAFMGGTGVGKSSLINRLAGKAIARAGIERPTSREVTLYHHQSVAIRHLPEHLPLAQIKIAEHSDDTKKNVIWIDMPDFDSTDQGNKHQVLEWLPHIDMLIYVVSPERYRDAKAWNLLLAEGGKHAWLFVLNQWDRGQTEQYVDFNQQLHKAGFAEPIIFKTICPEGLQSDQFTDLQSTITTLATEHVIEQLEQRSSQLKKHELKQSLHHASCLLGSREAFAQLPTLWQTQWQSTAQLLQEGFAWPLQQLAVHYANHTTHLSNNQATKSNLWDAWAEARFDDALDEFVSHADQLGIPVTPLKKHLSPLRQKASKIVQTQTELAARQSLIKPGNALQRGLLKFIGLCEIILPLTAIAWVSYQVFIGFYTSNMTSTAYLGVDFAIHSGLLIAINWLTPFFILKKLKPSLEKSALKGLNKGLAKALNMIEGEVLLGIENINHQHKEQLKLLAGIIKLCGDDDTYNNSAINDNVTLSRMLVD